MSRFNAGARIRHTALWKPWPRFSSRFGDHILYAVQDVPTDRADLVGLSWFIPRAGFVGLPRQVLVKNAGDTRAADPLRAVEVRDPAVLSSYVKRRRHDGLESRGQSSREPHGRR